MRKPRGLLTFLGSIMIVASIGMVIFGGYIMMTVRGSLGMILGLLFWLGATDLICAVFGKTLIKPGPLVESMYPLLKEERLKKEREKR